MSVPAYRERVTVMDVLEAGACIQGVLEWVRDRGVIVARTADYPCEKWISEAAGAVGDGGGNGYGVGYGYGYGYGDGCGDGNGDGNGTGVGYGYGYGNGNGYGYGNGDGNGYGDLGLVEAAL